MRLPAIADVSPWLRLTHQSGPIRLAMDSLLAWLLLVAGLLGLFRTVVGGMLATWTAR